VDALEGLLEGEAAHLATGLAAAGAAELRINL